MPRHTVRSEEVSEFVGYRFHANGTIVHRDSGKEVTVFPNGTLNLRDADGKKKRVSAHRMIAEAFVENPEGAKFVRFKDGNPMNRAASNLKWITAVRPEGPDKKTIIRMKSEGARTIVVAETLGKTPQYVSKIWREYKQQNA